MKFLTISTVKDTFSMLPVAMERQLLEATLAWMDGQKKQGKLVEAYEAPGGTSLVISEHPSAEDLVQTLAAIPMGGFLDFKVHALADFHTSMQVHIEACKQAEKAFPAAPK